MGAGEQETAAAREKCAVFRDGPSERGSESECIYVTPRVGPAHPSPHLQSRCKFSATRRFGSATAEEAADKTRREEAAATAAESAAY